MRSKSFIAVFILLAAAFISAGSVSAQSFAGGRNRPVGAIEQQVFKKLIALPNYGVFDHIAFKVDGDTVTLYGKVLSLGTKSSAARAVRRVPGVANVVNNIQNLPPSAFDNTIRRRILRSFVNSPGLYLYLREPNPGVRIVVDRGHVTLEGYVNNRGTSSLMNALANGVPGVFSVTNNLVAGEPR